MTTFLQHLSYLQILSYCTGDFISSGEGGGFGNFELKYKLLAAAACTGYWTYVTQTYVRQTQAFLPPDPFPIGIHRKTFNLFCTSLCLWNYQGELSLISIFNIQNGNWNKQKISWGQNLMSKIKFVDRILDSGQRK